ncbi:MAG: hypothetical protein EOP04_18785 [Proteobacteria bacterium]|nr:MAG: hypothetical protein EOP04_18785 [Pseudomonadota bacterium]
MQTITGTVNRLDKNHRINSAGNHLQTTYHATFLINGRQILVELPQPIMIEEGEKVSVTGQDKNGAFKALAYRNLDTKVSASGPFALFLSMGAVAIVVSIAFIATVFTTFGNDQPMLFLFVPPTLIFIFGTYFFIKGLKIKKALNHLNTFT